jgi:flagellar motor protein MotB
MSSSTDLDGSDETGEGYFASISDLMVGILFVFLLMLTVFALNFRDAEDQQTIEYAKYQALKQEAQAAKQEAEDRKKQADEAKIQAIKDRKEAEDAAQKATEAFRSAEEQKRMAADQKRVNDALRKLLQEAADLLEREAEQRQIARRNLIETLTKNLSDRNIAVIADPNAGLLHVSGDLLFDSGSFVLKEEARQTVKVLAEVLGKVLPCYADGGVRTDCPQDSGPILEALLVEGHTDHQPYRDAQGKLSSLGNDRLSTERALAVFEELWESRTGLDGLHNADQLALLGFSGYGDRRPLPDAQGSTEADYKRNRRIDLRFVLTPKTSSEFEELRKRIDAGLRTQ